MNMRKSMTLVKLEIGVARTVNFVMNRHFISNIFCIEDRKCRTITINALHSLYTADWSLNTWYKVGALNGSSGFCNLLILAGNLKSIVSKFVQDKLFVRFHKIILFWNNGDVDDLLQCYSYRYRWCLERWDMKCSRQPANLWVHHYDNSTNDWCCERADPSVFENVWIILDQ